MAMEKSGVRNISCRITRGRSLHPCYQVADSLVGEKRVKIISILVWSSELVGVGGLCKPLYRR